MVRGRSYLEYLIVVFYVGLIRDKIFNIVGEVI